MTLWFLILAGIIWWTCWRPDMMDWWHNRHTDKADLRKLRKATYLDDMFGDKR